MDESSSFDFLCGGSSCCWVAPEVGVAGDRVAPVVSGWEAELLLEFSSNSDALQLSTTGMLLPLTLSGKPSADPSWKGEKRERGNNVIYLFYLNTKLDLQE